MWQSKFIVSVITNTLSLMSLADWIKDTINTTISTSKINFIINFNYRKLGLLAHAPITLSGKKYALNKVYALNKQVSKYVRGNAVLLK